MKGPSRWPSLFEEGRPWRISPSLRLRHLVGDYLRIEAADDSNQWFLLSSRALPDFILACAKLRRQIESLRSTSDARRKNAPGYRRAVIEDFSLVYKPSTDEVVAINGGIEVLRFGSWELAALAGGVAAAFGGLAAASGREAP